MSAPVEVGENFTYTQTFTNPATGVLADVGTVTFTVTLPDGTTTSPATTHPAVGTYAFDYLTAQTGRHPILTDGTGGYLAADHDRREDVLNVELAGRYLVSFDDAIAHMRATSTITTIADRQELRWLILASSDAVERAIGRVLCRRSIVDVFDGGNSVIMLRQIPLRDPDGSLTITSVVENTTTLTLNTDFLLSRTGWRLIRGSTLNIRPWLWGQENITATYVAGCVNTPPVLRKITLTAIERMWQSSQQQPHPALDADLAVTQALGELTPVEQMAWDSFAAPGFA